MRLHELRPPEGATRKRTRVGRGIAAGGGKTAGRGTKGQKSRAGASIPAWFEGGQTPLHIRIPKLRGFRNINRVQLEVVNVGAIGAAVEAGRLVDGGQGSKGKAAPVTVNADLLKDAGLVKDTRRPLKILGGGDLGVALFVVADAFTRSAREKIEAAGGTAQLIEIPTEPLAALGVERPVDEAVDEAAAPDAGPSGARESESEPPATEASADPADQAPKASRRRARPAAAGLEAGSADVAVDESDPEVTATSNDGEAGA